MRKAILSLIVLSLALCIASTARAETITLVADEWAPYNMTPGSPREGYIVDIARKAFEAKGHTLMYRVVPWKRALEETRAGKFNGVIGASRTDATGFIFPEEELAVNRLTFMTAATSRWTFTKRDDVRTIRLGVIEGYDYRAWLMSYIREEHQDQEQVQIMHGNTPLEQNIRKLLSGRLDAVVDSENALLFTSRNMGVRNQVRIAGRDSEPAYIHVAFSPALKESRTHAIILSEGIRRMRADGSLKKILDSYGLRDWR